MLLAVGNQDLEFGRIKNAEILNPKIEDGTKGRELPQFQDYHRVNWQEYTFQQVVDAVAVESIVVDIDVQYVEEIKEDYMGYNNHTIKTMLDQLQTWYVITTK